MPARHIALVPEFGMNPSDLARVSAALQKQVTRDLEPIWQVAATVDAFPSLEDVPAGYWPIILTFRAVGSDAGIHVDRNGQPFAILEITPSWSLTASHVCLEMITDPFGSRTFPGPSPRPDQGDVEFLGAVCDPCEHADFAYVINDVLVSDFCTPAFWDPAESSRDRRSFTGAIQAAYQVLPGGHLSWYDPTTNRWWLRRLSNGVLSDVEVGSANHDQGSVREFMGRHSPHLSGTKMSLDAFEARVGMRRQRALRASQSRAFWLRSAFGVRAPEALEHDGEVRAAIHGTARRARVLSSSSPTPAGAVSEPSITVDESALEPSEPGIEREIAQALERVQGEIRSTTPPPPAVAASRKTLPPPLPPNTALPTPLPPPPRVRGDTLPPPPPIVPAPVIPVGGQAPVMPFSAYSSLPPGTTIPPASVSIAPSSRVSAGPPSIRPRDNRVIFVGMVAAAALVIAAVAITRSGVGDSSRAAAAHAPPIEVEPRAAVGVPQQAGAAVNVAPVTPPPIAAPQAPAPQTTSVPGSLMAVAPIAVVASSPVAVSPVAVSPAVAASTAAARAVVPRVVVAAPPAARPVPSADLAPPPPAGRPETAAAIDNLIDDRR